LAPWDVEGVAEADEPGALDRSVVVEHTGQHLGLVGHDAHRAPVEAREADDDVGGEIRLDLEKVMLVRHDPDQRLHVVRLVRIVRQEAVQLGVLAVDGIGVLRQRGRVGVVLGEKRQELAQGFQRGVLAVIDQVGDTAPGGVNVGAAELLGGHVLAGDLLDHLGAGEEHVGTLPHHDHEIGDGRRIDGAAGAGAQDHGDLGDHAGAEDVFQEDVRVSGQRVHALLDAGAA